MDGRFWLLSDPSFWLLASSFALLALRSAFSTQTFSIQPHMILLVPRYMTYVLIPPQGPLSTP